jgi:hypothetical protein
VRCPKEQNGHEELNGQTHALDYDDHSGRQSHWAHAYPRATVALEAGNHSPWISRYLTGLGAKVIVGNRCLSDARRRPTGIKTRCKRCNAAEGDVARFCGIVVCLINTGDLAIFGLFGRFVAKTAVSRWNGRLFRLDVPAV